MSVVKTQSRERAVLLLFEADSKTVNVEEILSSLDVEPEKYVLEILHAYKVESTKVEELIDEHTKGWKKERLPAFDRAVLRMAISELVRSAEIPVGTIISESVTLCENYSTPESPKFINGVLSTIAHKVRGVELINSAKEKKQK